MKSTRQDIEGLIIKIKIVFAVLLPACCVKDFAVRKSNTTESEISFKEKKQEKLKTLSVLKSASSRGSFHYAPHL